MVTTLLYLGIIGAISFTVPLLVDRFGREYLIGLLPIFLLTGNVLAESFTSLGPFLTSFAIPVYAGTFLITDIVSERYGIEQAKRAVWLGLIGQVFFVVILWCVLHAPVFPEKLDAIKGALEFMPSLILASCTAYFVSQFLDVWVFHKIREITGARHKWLRNVGSTAVSQLLDTAIFLGIAFYGRPPTDTIGAWVSFVLTTWIVKVAVAMLDTPFFYLATRNDKAST